MSGCHEARARMRVIVCGGGMVIISGMERLVVRALRSNGVAIHFILNSWGNERIRPFVDVMFVPSILFGVFMGVAYRLARRMFYAREPAAGFVTVVFWMSLYLFEKSWVTTLGISVTLLISLGGLVYIAEWGLRHRGRRRCPALARTSRARTKGGR